MHFSIFIHCIFVLLILDIINHNITWLILTSIDQIVTLNQKVYNRIITYQNEAGHRSKCLHIDTYHLFTFKNIISCHYHIVNYSKTASTRPPPHSGHFIKTTADSRIGFQYFFF